MSSTYSQIVKEKPSLDVCVYTYIQGAKHGAKFLTLDKEYMGAPCIILANFLEV